jgi:transcriptional regulator with XRE-family HTH domain
VDDLKREGRRQSDLWRGRIGAGVRRAREQHGLTQSELAALVGVDIATISKTEIGKTVPDFATIETLADILGLSLDALVGRQTPEATLPIASGAAESRSGDIPPEGDLLEALREMQMQMDTLTSLVETNDRRLDRLEKVDPKRSSKGQKAS